MHNFVTQKLLKIKLLNQKGAWGGGPSFSISLSSPPPPPPTLYYTISFFFTLQIIHHRYGVRINPLLRHEICCATKNRAEPLAL